MTAVAPPTAPPALSHRQIQWLLSGLMTGLLLAALDQTVVGTALPTIVGQLGGMAHYSWVVTAYLLASTASTPLYGRMSDLYGRRPVFLFAIGTFVLGSVLAGAAQTMTQLVVTRGVQGLGAGGLMTLAFTVVSDVVAPRDRGRYQGFFGAAFGLSSVAGPLAGGWLAEHDWRWIFYLNVPLGLLALVVCDRVLRLVPAVRRRHVAVDWAGAALLVTGVSCLLLALSWGGEAYPWHSAPVAGLFGAGAVLGALFVLRQRVAAEPILPLGLFRRRTFSLATAASFLFGVVMFGAVVYLPLYLQVVRGAAPARSGMLMLPMMAGIIVTSVLSGRMISRVGRYKWFPVAGAAAMVVGLLLCAGLTAASPLSRVSTAMVVLGVGMGLCMQALVLAVQNGVDRAQLGAATASATFFRTLGGSFGVAALGAVLAAGIEGGPAGAVRLDDPAGVAALPAPVRLAVQAALADGLQAVFLAAAAVTAVTVLVTALMPDVELRGAPPPR
ncbi:MAG TPA: MDR family MFS transporter [Pilimelia sp.]|nr:MDR family MFS transporter [Pilimelia sp.]